MWVLINGKEHIRVKTLEEGSKLIEEILKQNTGQRVQLIPSDVYNTREDRKTKRGKRS